jgi:hypothetical protein
MSTSHLARIAYASATRSELSRTQLDTMLSTWRRLNAHRGVTGFFLYHRESVFQLLEGFPDVVHDVYRAIADDPRHQFVAKLIDEPIHTRSFGDWSMGNARVVRTKLGAVAPLRRFLDPEFRYWNCDPTMAIELVGAFTTGPWRRAIS